MEINLAERSKEIATEEIRIRYKVKEIKAKKLIPKLLKDVIKKINKASNKGELYIKYKPWIRYLLGQWDNVIANLLILELKDRGYECSGCDTITISWC